MIARFPLPLLRRAILLLGAALSIGAAAATPYDTWAAGYGLSGANEAPTANPDGDKFLNALEFAFGTDPTVPETNYSVAPALQEDGAKLRFVYRVSSQSEGVATYRVLRSLDAKTWATAPGTVELLSTNGSRKTYGLAVPSDAKDAYYELEVSVPWTGSESDTPIVTTVTIGTNIGANWDGLPPIATAVIRTEAPKVGGTGPDKDKPDLSKYPQVAGTSLNSFTDGLLKDYANAKQRPPLRSWLGFFLWANGTPPPGISAGFPVTGSYDTTKPWDYFGYNFAAGSDPSTGKWVPLRLDQQPLYATPLMLNYSWPPGLFGYVTKPLQFFPGDMKYWADKQIVRGVNISQANPFFSQYADYYTLGDLPDAWRESWLFSSTRPLETTVLVVGNLTPAGVLADGKWNDIGDPNPQKLKERYQPFPYSVWDPKLPAKDQTPFNLQVDRVGDFDTDIVWEGTNKNAATYAKNKYVRTPFDKPGQGNYFKMTVAQGSPFVWCETNNAQYATFYDLIRVNIPGKIDNNEDTGAEVVVDATPANTPRDVPGVTGVKYVLLYGDHVNPNQFYHEALPVHMQGVAPYAPGGFNPPGNQHNYNYTAVFFRADSVADMKFVKLAPGTKGPTDATANNGIDAQQNPYFYLQFKTTGKNWFVVGSVPVMHYYAQGVTPDSEAVRLKAAQDWADEMGKYAFNFPVASKISYSVKNMYQADTTYGLTFVNPFVAAGVSGAEGMTANPKQTVLALMPHHYQPLTLGPDLTTKGSPEVVWSPLRKYDQDFAVPASAPPQANKNTAATPVRWGYWSMLGNLKPVITGSFSTSYPFQNFLPVMPSSDWTRKFDVNGALSVNVTNVGTGNVNVVAPPAVTLAPQPLAGFGAVFAPELNPDGSVKSPVKIVSGGSGYVDGSPSGATYALFDPAPNPSETAKANVTVVGGTVTEVNIAVGGKYTTAPGLTLTSPPLGSGAELTALLEPNTGRIQQINVSKPGSKYPIGYPSPMKVNIASPTSPTIANGGVQAEAVAQVGGDGNILAVFMTNKGFGYSPTITLEQAGMTEAPIIVPNFGPNPTPDTGGPLLAGAATVISAGSGFDYSKPYTIKVNSTGTGAQATIVKPGTVYAVEASTAPGVGVGGSYPSSGDAAKDAAGLKVTIPPAPGGSATQALKVLPSAIIPSAGSAAPVLTNAGSGYKTSPVTTATFKDDDNNTFQYAVNVGPDGKVASLGGYTPVPPATGAPKITTPKTLTFSGGAPTTPAAGLVYSLFSVAIGKPGTIVPDDSQPVVGGYAGDVDVTFSGGEIETATEQAPKINFAFTSDGKLDPTKLSVDPTKPGKGWSSPGVFQIEGGRGFDAILQPFVDSPTAEAGHIIGVKVLRGGSGYPNPVGGVSQVFATTIPPTGGAEFEVMVKGGSISEVKVIKGGKYGAALPPIVLTSKAGSTNPSVDDPKGKKAQISFQPDGTGGITNLTVIEAGSGYIPGSETQGSETTPQARVMFSTAPFAAPTAYSKGFIARVIPPQTQVQQVMYDAMTSYYTNNFASKNLAPFGGGFEGESAPDGYGLGNQLGAAGRFMSDIFNFQQFVSSEPGSPDQPDLAPSSYALRDASVDTASYAQPSLQTNSPMFTLSGGLKLSVQSLQRTITRLFDNNIAGNNPTGKGLETTWKMNYFTLYDENAGRVIVNPSATVPGNGITSSTGNPPTPDGNTGKTGLAVWKPGDLWSGFGVSDQWNDQHYFYGYYLSTAALAGIFDHAWEPKIAEKPASLWVSPNQMGSGIDQWLMTLAYDPDNAALDSSLYQIPGLTYQKFAFFDQWNGHSWATGVAPAPAYAEIDGGAYNVWSTRGTGSNQYNQENENSIFEGLQAWSATVLWGGATDRKPVVDLGIYLMATEMAAGDLYFRDQNLNLGVNGNAYSWAPVTTVASSAVPDNGGNNNIPAYSDYTTASPVAFYQPYPSFGKAVGAGNSLLKKADNTINNFYFGYPAGSKLIQAFPPTPWTLAISRNTDFMRRWAGTWMRKEWAQIRDGGTRFYSAPDWLSMAMIAALCGVPYNPGDQPYPETGISTTPSLPPYVDRLWSQWVTRTAPLGSSVSLKSFVNQTSAMSFLLALDEYGTPDWTYIAVITDVNGTEKDDTILFSAVFSKVEGANVKTTFVLFNPGWETRYAKFFRLDSNGVPQSDPASGSTPLTVEPKRMVMITKTFPIPPTP